MTKLYEEVFTMNSPNACYDFDDVMVVRDLADGKLYAAYDAGCSCPIPFENHVFPTDFVELRSAQDLRDYVKEKGNMWLDTDVDAAIKAAGLT